MFASDNEHIALMVNMTSVVSSAFTIIVFVDDFEKISKSNEPNQKEDKAELNTSNAIVILGSSFVEL
jgi:hypothetical protein